MCRPFAILSGVVWQERFHRAALELIAITTSSASGTGRADRLAAAAATDAAAPALLKIERAAIAAATPISYQPQELLLLMYEHLKASGLHTAAASLAKEAGLSGSSKGQQSYLAAAVQQQQQQQLMPGVVGLAGSTSPALGGGPAAAAAGSSAPAQHAGAAAIAAAIADGFATPAAAAAATPVLGHGKGLSSSSGDPWGQAVAATPAAAAAGTMSKDRRKTLSLGPNLLSHLVVKEGSVSDSEQQQQGDKQQLGRLSLSRLTSAPAAAAAAGSAAGMKRLPSPPLAAAAAAGSAATANGGFMSPPLPQTAGTKRRASAGVAAAAAGFETPAAKRQAVGDATAAAGLGSSTAAPEQQAASTSTSTAAAAAEGSLGPLQLPVSPHVASTPAQPSSSKRSGKPPPAAAAAGSDAEYLQSLNQQQQQQQQQSIEVFHTQGPPATPQVPISTSNINQQQQQQQLGVPSGSKQGAGVSSSSGATVRAPFLALTPSAAAGSAAAGGSNFLVSPSPGPWTGFAAAETPGAVTHGMPGTPSFTGLLPQLSPGAGGPASTAAAAAGAGTPSAAAAATSAFAAQAALPTGANPLLTNLPCRQLGKAGGGLVRRLSGGVDVPHRMTPIAEAAPEPKPLPLHVQVAARDVMTGALQAVLPSCYLLLRRIAVEKLPESFLNSVYHWTVASRFAYILSPAFLLPFSLQVLL
jgi:hypothetical protein